MPRPRSTTPPIPLTPLLPRERRAAAGLATIFAMRMLGLFMILPVFALYAHDLAGATPLLVGLAIGAYGLTQAMFQIPFGVASDRIGRKPVIYAGLVIFALGSVLAATADSIVTVIIGRALQGSGAIAAAAIALTADLTRESVRTRAMAAIGISVALSFAAALVLGPVLGAQFGISGIFWLTAGFALLGMLVLALVVPDPIPQPVPLADPPQLAEPVRAQIRAVLANRTLLRLDIGIFLLHLTMVSLFVVLPLSLLGAGLAPAAQWQLYLPVVLLAIALMVPFIVLAERAGRVRAVLLGAALALAAALSGLALVDGSILAIGALLVVMFTVFNIMEAVLPALVSKAARSGDKGTAAGVFASAQFIGAFLGGLLGGLAHETLGPQGVYLLGALAALLWFAVAVTLRPPSHQASPAVPDDPAVAILPADQATR